MRGVNKVIIVGTLGADPEVKQFPNGGSITTISVATSEQWNDKQTGERREATEWHRITFNNKLAEIAAQYLRKGRQVYVEGSLRTRKYQDQSGQDRFITEIRADQMQMLGGNPAGQPMGNDGMGGGTWANNSPNPNNAPNYNQNYNNNQGYNNPGYGNQNAGGQPNNGQNYQPNNYANNAVNTQPAQAPNRFIQNNADNGTIANAPQIDTPKPGVIDDDVPFVAISNQLVGII